MSANSEQQPRPSAASRVQGTSDYLVTLPSVRADDQRSDSNWLVAAKRIVQELKDEGYYEQISEFLDDYLKGIVQFTYNIIVNSGLHAFRLANKS